MLPSCKKNFQQKNHRETLALISKKKASPPQSAVITAAPEIQYVAVVVALPCHPCSRGLVATVVDALSRRPISDTSTAAYPLCHCCSPTLSLVAAARSRSPEQNLARSNASTIVAHPLYFCCHSFAPLRCRRQIRRSQPTPRGSSTSTVPFLPNPAPVGLVPSPPPQPLILCCCYRGPFSPLKHHPQIRRLHHRPFLLPPFQFDLLLPL